jgi:DNA adenine methylase
VPNYVEPFFGSGAVLLNRPHEPRIETVNDKDGFVSNFWRAVQHDPEQTAAAADYPVNENDLHARHIWLVQQRETLVSRIEGDPEFYDAKIAGWWAWGMSCWIGSGFCSGDGPWQTDEEGKLVHLGTAGQGVNRQLVKLMTPTLLQSGNTDIYDFFAALAHRLRRVRICSGDWSRVCGPTPTFKQGLTGVFLDPPYAFDAGDDGRAAHLYRIDSGSVAAEVRAWAIENGTNPLMRIALCGYEGEHEMPPEWECYAWKAHGGYGSQGDERGRDNAQRERIWFSPACIKGATQAVLL